MKMNQKGFANIVLIAIIVILLGAVGYFALRKSTAEPKVFTTNNNTQPIQPQVTPPPTANQTLPSPQAGMLRYQSSLGFSIDYPEKWRIESMTIEKFGSIEEAEKVSGNYFSIYSYPANNSYNPGGTVPQKEIKIEIWVSSNVYKSLDEWIKSLAFENVLRSENITIDGKNAKKILYSGNGEMGKFTALAIFYLDGKRTARFFSFPPDTKYSQEFDAIVKTFSFTN